MARVRRRFGAATASRPAIRHASTESHAHGDGPVSSDAEMAWLLADATDCLASADRARLFVELGCGENYLAIERILKALVSEQVALPYAVLAKLTHWLNGHAGSPEEPCLRELVSEILRQRREARGQPGDSAVLPVVHGLTDVDSTGRSPGPGRR